MKSHLLIAGLIGFLILAGSCSFAAGKQNKKEKDMLDNARELTYEGQIEHAQKLLSEKNDAAAKTKDEKSDDSGEFSLIVSMLWGAFGTGYFLYGKKAPDVFFMLSGIGLMVMPIFVGDVSAMLVAGIVLLLLPFKDRFLQTA